MKRLAIRIPAPLRDGACSPECEVYCSCRRMRPELSPPRFIPGGDCPWAAEENWDTSEVVLAVAHHLACSGCPKFSDHDGDVEAACSDCSSWQDIQEEKPRAAEIVELVRRYL